MVTSELNVLSLVNRQPLIYTYRGQDARCSICPGDKCLVPAGTTTRQQPVTQTEHVAFDLDSAKDTKSKRATEETEVDLADNCTFIVPFYDAFTNINEGEICLLFEYMSHGDLRQLCERGWMPDNYDMAVICYSVLSALVELHDRCIIHRDIKVR